MTFEDYQKQALSTVLSTGDEFKDLLSPYKINDENILYEEDFKYRYKQKSRFKFCY